MSRADAIREAMQTMAIFFLIIGVILGWCRH